jgi:hypothetical protein
MKVICSNKGETPPQTKASIIDQHMSNYSTITIFQSFRQKKTLFFKDIF